MPTMAWSSYNDGMAAADSSIEEECDRGMVAETAIRATTANAKIIGRIMAGLHFPAIMCRRNRFKVQNGVGAGLKPRAGFRERRRGRFLDEIVKNDSGSRRDNAGDKACKNELAHPVSPVFRNYPNTFPNGRFRVARTQSRPRPDFQAGKANASVSTSTKVRPSEPTRA